MLESITEPIERRVDDLVSKIVTRIMVLIPALVAIGFGVSAATVKLVDAYGTVSGLGIMAAAFAIVTALAAMASSFSARSNGVHEQGASTSAHATPDGKQSADSNFQDMFSNLVSSDTLKALAGTAAPLAFPIVTRLVLRNLPLVLALVALAYVGLGILREQTQSAGDHAAPPSS